MQQAYRRLVLAATALTFVLVVLGAWVRLGDAGLGCPDWPGCYGALTPHHAAEDIRAAEAAAPHGPVSMTKAWKEMVHRYVAGMVGVLILAIAATAWRGRRTLAQSPWLATALVAVVGLQAMFGKWTVTMLLKPAIVTGHLIGGMLTLGLLAWLAARQARPARLEAPSGLRVAAAAAFAVLALQIALGGWVSTNYAALACSDLPTCQGAWLPNMDFANAFHVLRELGRTADGELLSIEALTAIHWLHRVGALVTLAALGALAVALMRLPQMVAAGALLLAAVLAQFALGLGNVAFALPLALAAAHNGGAALLVVLLATINAKLAPARAGVRTTGILHESPAA